MPPYLGYGAADAGGPKPRGKDQREPGEVGGVGGVLGVGTVSRGDCCGLSHECAPVHGLGERYHSKGLRGAKNDGSDERAGPKRSGVRLKGWHFA